MYLSKKNKQKHRCKFRRETRKREGVKNTESKVTGNYGGNYTKGFKEAKH